MQKWINECIDAFLRKEYNIGVKILQSNLPKKLFKYCRLNEYTLENLMSNSFYMATLKDLNDPYEFYPTVDFEIQILLTIKEQMPIFKEMGIHITQSDIDIIEASNDRYDKFMEICLGKGYTLPTDKHQQQKEFYGNFDEMIQSLKRQMRFQSFSEKNHSTVMWSHYADCHKGICIEYNPLSIGTNIPLLKVEYSNRRLDISEIENLESKEFNKMIYEVMLLKAKDWQYEEEWRLIYHLYEQQTDDSVAITIPAPMPTAIYIGTHFDKNEDSLRKNLYAFSEKNKIPIYKMHLDTTEFKIVPVDF